MALQSSKASLTLELPPSCIEFWPYKPGWAVIGTYNLQKAEKPSEDEGAMEGVEYTDIDKRLQLRNGSLVVVKIDRDDL
jgi:diphthine methyl ester acylhydrolase